MSQVGCNLRLSQLHPLKPSHIDQSQSSICLIFYYFWLYYFLRTFSIEKDMRSVSHLKNLGVLLPSYY